MPYTARKGKVTVEQVKSPIVVTADNLVKIYSAAVAMHVSVKLDTELSDKGPVFLIPGESYLLSGYECLTTNTLQNGLLEPHFHPYSTTGKESVVVVDVFADHVRGDRTILHLSAMSEKAVPKIENVYLRPIQSGEIPKRNISPKLPTATLKDMATYDKVPPVRPSRIVRFLKRVFTACSFSD